MPRYVATIPSAWPDERAFAYMSDFSNARAWDPSVAAATRVDAGPVREGSAFELQIRNGRRVMPFRYVVTELSNRRVVLRAETPRFESVDTITVRDAGDASEIQYDAFLSGRGIARLANPLIARVFRRMGDAARAQLGDIVGR